MKHIRLRILAAITCLALLMNVAPAIGEGDADFVDIPTSTEIVEDQSVSGEEAPTGSASTPPAASDTPAPTEDATPSPSAEPTEDATPAPSAESTTEPTETPTATCTPAEIRAAELGLSLDALAEALGVSTEALCAMTADEIDAALAALQSAMDLSEDFEIESGVLVAYNGTGGDVVIPDGVTAIGPGAFQDCTALKSVALPDGVYEIGMSAFEGCTALTRVSLCDELRTIGPSAFKDCIALRSIKLPDALEILGEFAFQGCERLEEIVLPDSLLQLGGLIDRDDQHIFQDCTALKSATLPKDMRALGASMFAGCTALEELHLPATLSAIESGAFSGCTSLQTLTIPSGVAHIASDAFANCPNLRLTLSYGSAAESACKASGIHYSYSDAPNSVALSAPRTTIGVGEKLQLNVQLEPDDVVGTLSFSSSNTRYVTVDRNGVVTGKRAGSATITVKTYNGVKATLKITVKNAPTSVSLRTTRTLLGVGETAQLTATLSSGSAGGYSFSSSDETKLTVDASGLVTALDAGEVTVTVTTYNGKKRSGVITIAPAPEQITLSAEALTVGALDSATLGYSLNEGSAGAVSFSSSDEAVATVDSNGKIHALTEGSATITATTYNGISADCALTVVPAPTGVALSAPRTTIGVGEKLQLNVHLEPDDVVGTLTFSSSNTRYVTVDQNGVVTGKRAGSATITVKTYNGVKATLKITVKNAPTSVSLKTTRALLGVGETAQLTASLSSGSAGGYSFTSSDETKLTVDASGLVTALDTGEVTVTVTTYNGKKRSGVITIVPAPEQITLSTETLTVGALDSATLGYSLNEGSAGAVSFASSDEAVATVDANGKIHALTEGSATITATTYNGISADCALTVVPAPTGVALSSPRTTIGVGEKLQLNVQLEPDDVVGTLTFSSSNTRYVTVDQNGVVTGKRAGSATITVKTYNGVRATLKITVKNAPTSVSLKTTRTLLGVGETAQLTASLSSGSAGGYSFSSSDETKLSVDASGLVTALDAGEVTVTVTTYNGKKRSGVITIVPAPEQITLSAEALTVGALDSATLGYSLNEGSAGAVSFASSDEAVATVDANGKIHALTEGSATITATTYNGISADCALTVVPAPTGVSLSSPRTTIGVGEKLQLNVQLEPDDVVGTLTFSSSNTRYVTVDQNGVVTGKRAGSATITVKTYNGVKATLKITVKNAPTSVSLKTTRALLGVGETAQLTATLSSGSAGGYSFSSSDETKLTVDASGLVTALDAGEVTVTVTTYNGKKRSGVITIVPAPEQITLSAEALTVGALDSATLGYSLNEGSAGAVSFSSSDEAVATVDANGRIHALTEGSATITATTYNGVSADCALTVVPAPTGVTLSSPRTTIGVGEKLQLNVQLEPDDVVGTLTFSSSNTRYVTVDQNGVVTGKRAGSATITVKTYNGVKATLKITVKKAPTSVSLKTTRALLGVGETAQLTATLSSGSAGGYSFSSSDETKLTVGASGLVTALDAGEVTVTVTTYNGKKRSGVITIVPAPEQITLSTEALTVGALDSATLGYSLNEGSAGAVSFSSSDEAVATVDANGRIHTLTEGSATITATTYNGISADCALTVVPAPTYIVLPYATLNIGLGDRIQLEPEIDPGCVSAYRYSSSNTRYATVSEAGVITAKRVGSVTVTIKTYNGLSFKLKVNVKKAPSSLKLSPTSLVLGVGESAQLGHSITSGTATTLGYQSSDADIAAVTESGMVTGLAEGEAIVTAATHNGKTATCGVTVVPAPESISVSAAELLGVGQTAQLSAALLPESAHSTLRYEVISGDAVTVDDSGRIQAVQAGSATVRVSTYVDGVYADHTILVKPAPESLSFDADSYVVDIDETLQLSPILTPADCHTELTYSIARAGFFTIDEDGLVTPIMRGATTVTVKTYNGLSATITIQVVDPYFPESIKFAVAPPGYLELGMTYQPEVLVYPETALADLVWASSNPKIISVDAKTGFVTALSYGSATITATSTRNPALILSYKLVVLSPERCLKMPNRRTTSTSSISTTLSQIKNVRASAYLELESLYARGIISESDYNTRKAIVSRAFDMYLFPWMTNSLELYWKAANSENGAKDFKPGIVYYGMPYTQSNRTYNVDTALKSGRFYSTGSGYYMMDGSKFSDRNYPGNDCSSFVSMAIWGMGSSHSSDTTRSIGSSSAYVTLSDPTDLRPGDILNKSGSHVIMFLYYADAAKTQMVIIEQGGGEFDTNTCSCSIRTISTYLGKGYKMLRLAKLS